MKRLIVLAVCTVLSMAGPALAGLVEELAVDLKPVDGYVVLPVQGEFLIDLDASQGLAVGDLLAVIKPGEKITHPVTGALLGTLDVRKAVLQVTQVKDGFSHARPLQGSSKVVRGDALRRYAHLRASFLDYTGEGESLYAELSGALSRLEWQDYAGAQENRPSVPSAAAAPVDVDVLFVLEERGLSVRDPSYRLLRYYPVATVRQPFAAPVAADSRSSVPYRLEAAPAVPVGGVRYEATFPGFKSVGPLGFPAVTSDFVTQGQQLLLAASDGASIKVFTVSEKLQPLTEVKLADLAQVASLCWWQPKKGELYLAVTGWQQPKISSAIYAYKEGRLTPVTQGLPFLFGSFDRDGDGRRELLLTQNFDRNQVWGTLVKRAELKGARLETSEPGFRLPRRFSVIGSLLADITGNGQAETIFVRDGLLYVYSGTKELYKSPKMMGGTLSRFLFEEHPNARETATHFAAFELAPVVADLDGDGQLELLTVASDTGALSAPGLSPGVKKSWVSVLKMRDGMFIKGTLGEELDVPLQGLSVTEDRVLFVATETGSVFGAGGESQLLVFPLAAR